MKQILLSILFTWCCFGVSAQTTPQDFTTKTVRIWNSLAVGKGQYVEPDSCAFLDIGKPGGKKGVLMPRGSKDSITGTKKPALVLYNNSDSSFYYWDGSTYRRLLTDKDSLSLVGGTTDSVIFNTIYRNDSVRANYLTLDYDTSYTVFTDNFQRASLGSSYTNNAATLTFPSSAYMQITGGGGYFDKYVTRNYYSAMAQSEMSVTFVPTTQTSSTYGLAMGFKSAIGTNRDLVVQFALQNTSFCANKAALYYDVGSGMPFNIIDSSAALAWTVGDTLQGRLRRLDTAINVVFKNLSTGDSVILNYGYVTSSVATPILNNTSTVNLYNIGGTQKILEWKLRSLGNKRNDVWLVNSIGNGYSVSSQAHRYLNQLYYSRDQFTTIGGAGDRSAQYVLDLPEILAHNPRKIFISVGVNDVGGSVTVPAYSANIRTTANAVVAAGKQFAIVSIDPYSSTSVVPYNDSLIAIAARYGVDYINTYAGLVGSGTSLNAEYDSGDGLHLNDAGNDKKEEILKPYITKYLSVYAISHSSVAASVTPPTDTSLFEVKSASVVGFKYESYNLRIGTATIGDVAIPAYISLGGSFSTTANDPANAKFKLLDVGGANYGFNVSAANGVEYFGGFINKHTFFGSIATNGLVGVGGRTSFDFALKKGLGELEVRTGDDGFPAGIKAIFAPLSGVNSAFPNNSIYYSTDAGKLVYKDAGGSVGNIQPPYAQSDITNLQDSLNKHIWKGTITGTTSKIITLTRYNGDTLQIPFTDATGVGSGVASITDDGNTVVSIDNTDPTNPILDYDQSAIALPESQITSLTSDLAARLLIAKYIVRETPSGSVNGVNTTFVLANTPVAGTETVTLNGIEQEPGAGNDYTISSGTITYLTAPATGDKIRVTYISQ